MGEQEQALKDKGVRLTWRRQAIIDVFRSTDKHLSADDILAALKERKAHANSTTIYRNLEIMTKAGVLRHVDFNDGCCRYELNQGPCHHHLHCTRCGKVVEFGECEIVQLEKMLSERTGFMVQHHYLEIYGLCPACR